jgi:hypothetical protein
VALKDVVRSAVSIMSTEELLQHQAALGARGQLGSLITASFDDIPL